MSKQVKAMAASVSASASRGSHSVASVPAGGVGTSVPIGGIAGGPNMPSRPTAAPRMVVAIAKPEAQLRAGPTTIASASGMEVDGLNAVLAQAGVSLRPLFGDTEERLKAKSVAAAAAAPSATSMASVDEPDLSLFYYADAPDADLERLAEQLAALPTMAGAYVAPRPELAAALPQEVLGPLELNAMQPSPVPALPATPDFVLRQGYLDGAPGGIDARYAWTVPGGGGAGVRVIDCEGAWRFTHEDLTTNQGGIIRTPTSDLSWRNHGTAVAGEIGGDRNTFGITGIAPDANIRGCSIFDTGGLPAAIVAATDQLSPGDVILLEVQYGHPARGYTAVEWWPAEYAAIRYAVNRGVIVVEAAGNGNNNLDDPAYNTPLAGFPTDWRNAFNRSVRDSGAVLVGAGAPPPGTHGRNIWGPDRSRLDFSNYGSSIDVQGWGREVTTTGYGDLQGGASEDGWYTDQFSGTSSASPIVVGALACVQGVLRSAGRIPLSPARARELLRSSGSPQQDAPGRPRTERIGNRPNLRQLIAQALQTGQWIGVQFTGVVPANSTKRWFTHSWPAHWHVLWTVVPTSPRPGAPQLSWSVQVERASDRSVTYWISITNLAPEDANIEARYAVVGW
ncbi:S8 family peptidase [Methylibium rhizosphaerae]|uniref:S8 family peptidase n=1 Tax=Methylibium rhizosphaerae TaxID=2570323 RepID=UPI001C61381C|nr:S8 family peptidase [Methylibium rhizosphaerae]